MSDAISVSAPISGTDRTMSFEAGKLAQLADGAVLARIGDTVLLATAVASPLGPGGHRLLPADRRHRGAHLRGREDPRLVLPPGGQELGPGHPDLPAHRPPAAPVLPRGLPQRGAHVVGTIVGADQVNPHDVLAINAASAALMISGIPFDGPIGAVRVAYTTDGEWIPHPTYEEGEESTFELVVAGRALTEDADTDIAIMMVEAGGTEKSWSYYEDGAPKVTEEVLAQGLEAAKKWIRESINLQRQLMAAFTAARGPIETIPFSTFTDYEDDVWQRVQAVGTDAHRQGQPGHRQGRAQRRPRRGRRRDQGRPGRRVPRPRGRGEGGHPLAHQEARAQAHRRGRHAGRRPRHRRTSGRCRPRSTSSRPRTARRSSSGARPRSST